MHKGGGGADGVVQGRHKEYDTKDCALLDAPTHAIITCPAQKYCWNAAQHLLSAVKGAERVFLIHFILTPRAPVSPHCLISPSCRAHLPFMHTYSMPSTCSVTRPLCRHGRTQPWPPPRAHYPQNTPTCGICIPDGLVAAVVAAEPSLLTAMAPSAAVG